MDRLVARGTPIAGCGTGRIYPTILAAIGRPIPSDRHGISLLPVLKDPSAVAREYAIAGLYGNSVTITGGQWILHQAPAKEKEPLYWYDHCLARVSKAYLGPYIDGRRRAEVAAFPTPTWLSDKRSDPSELVNLAERRPDILDEMQCALRQQLIDLRAPPEQLARLGLQPLG